VDKLSIGGYVDADEFQSDLRETFSVITGNDNLLCVTANVRDLLRMSSKSLNRPSTLLAFLAMKWMDVASIEVFDDESRWFIDSHPNLVNVDGDIDRAPIQFIYEEEGLSELISFGDPEGGRTIMYCVSRGRALDIPDVKSIRWLVRRGKKELAKGRGFKEGFLYSAYNFFRNLKFVPYGMNFTSLPRIGENPFWYYCEQELESSVDKDSSEEYIKASANIMVVRILSWHRAFELSDTPTWVDISYDLCLLLMTTDVSNIPSDDVKLPMPFLSFELPRGIFRINTKVSGSTEVRNVTVITDTSEGEDCLVFMYHISRAQSEPDCFSKITTHKLVSGKLFFEEYDEYADLDPGDTATDSFTILGETMSEGEFTKRVDAFIVNAILYINSDDSDAKSSTHVMERKNKKGKNKRSNVFGRYEQLVLGSSVNLGESSRKAYEANLTGRKITYGFTVRGHWMNAACGKGRKERKRVWRRPCVKGKNIAKRIMSHTYKPAEPVSE